MRRKNTKRRRNTITQMGSPSSRKGPVHGPPSIKRATAKFAIAAQRLKRNCYHSARRPTLSHGGRLARPTPTCIPFKGAAASFATSATTPAEATRTLLDAPINVATFPSRSRSCSPAE